MMPKVLWLDEGLLAEVGGAAGPKWCAIFPVGVTRHRSDFPDGRIEFSRGFFEKMLSNWQRDGRRQLPVNYFHRGTTEYGDVTPIEQKVAAGWMTDFRFQTDDAGKEWFAALIDWTDKARGHIHAKELAYLSPEFATDGLNKATGKGQGPTLHGAALLNDPYLTELPRVAASDNPNAAQAAGASTMNKLAKMLGCAEGADEDTMCAALAAIMEKGKKGDAMCADLQAQVTTLTEKAAKVSLSDDAAVKLASDLKASSEKVVELSAKVQKLEAEKSEAAIETYLSECIKAGKLAPAMRDGVKALALAQGLDAVKKVWDSAPVVIPMGERGVQGEHSTSEKSVEEKSREFIALTDKYEKEGMSYASATSRVLRERPDLHGAFSAKNRA